MHVYIIQTSLISVAFFLFSKIKEQRVLKFELESLKPNKAVYVCQGNSNVFFKISLHTTLFECKSTINLKRTF